MKFAEAQRKMIQYLASPEFKSREDAETTLKSVPLLQMIIKQGYITDNSQEGLILTGFNPDTNRHYRIEERAYITGFMKEARGRKFVEWLNTYTDKVSFIIHSEPSKQFEKLFYEGDRQAIPSVPVTVSGSSETKQPIKILYPDTKLITIFPSSLMDATRKQAHINKAEHVVYICCFDPKYGRKASGPKGLYTDCMKGLGAI